MVSPKIERVLARKGTIGDPVPFVTERGKGTSMRELRDRAQEWLRAHGEPTLKRRGHRNDESQHLT